MTFQTEGSNRSLTPWIGCLPLLPCVSAVSAYLGLHDLLLVVFFALGFSAFMAILKRPDNFDDRTITVLIWSITFSLILASTLASDYLRGYDVWSEYFFAAQTLSTGLWNPAPSEFASVLSVGVLPAMISNLSALSLVQIFKFVYPLIYSIVTVVLYRVARKILAPAAAFLSVFLVMSYPTFYDEMLGLARQEIAEVLLVLLLFVLLSPTLSKGVSGKVSLVLLMIGVAVSHYSIFYISALIFAYSCLTSRAFRKTEGLLLFGLMVVAGLAWYTYITGGLAALKLSNEASSVLTLVTNSFLSSSSRPTELMKALGATPISPGPLQQLNRWTQIAVQLCLLLGFLVLLLKNKSVPEQKMFPLMTAGLILVGASIILPGLAATLNLNRIYQIALLFMAPFFIYGTRWFEAEIRRVKLSTFDKSTLHLAALILFLYFLFVSGWFTVVTAGSPTSLMLDANRMRSSPNPLIASLYYQDNTVTADVDGATWLHSYAPQGSQVCADIQAESAVLLAYGNFPPQLKGGFFANYLSPIVYTCDFSSSFAYLSEYNNIYGLGFTFNGVFPISDISPTLLTMNRIYSSGRTTTYW